MAEELRLLQTQADLVEGKFVRRDGRAMTAHRSIESTKGSVTTADGSCVVRLGSTCIICGLRGEIGEKTLSLDDINDLRIGVEVKLPFRTIGQFTTTEEEQKLSQQLQNILISGNVFRPKEISDRFFWVLHVSITCLDYDGNFFGAAVAAISGALSNLKLPVAVHDLDLDQLIVDDEYAEVDGDRPIAVSYGIINDKLVIDMNSDETLLSGGETFVVYSADGNILSMHKGGPTTDVQKLQSIMKQTKVHATTLRNQLLCK